MKRIISRKLPAAAFLSACTLTLLSCGSKPHYEYPFQDPSLSVDERVENLLSLLTPEEKVGLMMNKSISVDRLGIPSYNWWSEACHGVVQDGYTVFPQPVGMASSFDPALFYSVFSAVSDEARANWNRSDHGIWNVGTGERYYPGNPELTFWCPNVNIFRDPRWGRGQETCGEDPYLTSVLGLQTVRGMQGNDRKYFKTHACAKHYAVHSGPEPLRHSMDVSVSMRDLWETYLPAFKTLVVDGNVQEVMCAYQRYEGKPCCSSDRLLIDILRNKWNYKGIILTDCDAINNFYTKGQHETHPDALSASVDAILNGTDLECGKSFMSLTEGLKEGKISVEELDEHLRYTLRGRFELGMFDPEGMVPWNRIGEDVISSGSHDELAVQMARESMVLLKNNGVLPLSKGLKKILVVGPNADDTALLNGNYGGTPTDAHKHSILEGIRNAVPGTEVAYSKACELVDEYNTTNHLRDFNGGQGMQVTFYNETGCQGEPAAEGMYDEIRFSTFGGYGFADGVNTESFSLVAKGSWVADFTGDLKYHIATDNGYTLKVNGCVVEKAVPSVGARGFWRGGQVPEYKSIAVTQGKNYDVEILYDKGAGPFGMFNAQFCERTYADFASEKEMAADADAVIVVGGISSKLEGEGGDKADIELPKVQQRLLAAMRSTGRPVIFVNCSGSCIAFASVDSKMDALLQAWYPGQGGAKALAEVIFGDFNPSGKLPVTFYASNDDLPYFLDYSMEGRTYRYFSGKPMYAFGYGLSYTGFEYGEAELSKKSMKEGECVTITVPVTNTGDRQGMETVQVYVKSLDRLDAPIKALKGFEKLDLAPHSTVTSKIILSSGAFEYYDGAVDGLAYKPGRYRILYGSSSRDEDLKSVEFECL